MRVPPAAVYFPEEDRPQIAERIIECLESGTLRIAPDGPQEGDKVLVGALIAYIAQEGELQIASFHPRYRFADTDPDDIANFTNRSPYPTLHVLREASVTRAVVAFPDAGDIYEKNIRTLRELGKDGWDKLHS